ncbi:MAG TPA: hypothetical protein VHY10_17970 [Xanthobacteraceae bacterium]|nr:hypothetical protein [Xanthobacteraceae bacterium]
MISVVTNFFWCVIGFLQTYSGAVTAAATVAIGFFTFFLVRVTNRQARLTKAAVDAAKKSADAAMGVALPRFEVTQVRIQRTGGDTLAESLWRPINVTLVNFGQSAAVILRECIIFWVGDVLPAIPDYSLGRVHDIGFRFPIIAGDSHPISAQAVGMDAFGNPFGIDPIEADRVAEGQSTLWLYGYLVYRDFLDQVATKGFCARLEVENASGRFVQDGPESYSKTKRG